MDLRAQNHPGESAGCATAEAATICSLSSCPERVPPRNSPVRRGLARAAAVAALARFGTVPDEENQLETEVDRDPAQEDGKAGESVGVALEATGGKVLQAE